MAEEWFYSQNGQQMGPVDFSQLQQMAASGQLHPGEMVWKQGMPNWTPAQSIPALFSPPAPMPGVPPVPPPAPGYPQPPLAPLPGYGAPSGYAPQPMGYATPGMPGKSYAGMAKASMILGIIGLVLFGMIVGVLAIIFGGIALSGMGKTGDTRGKGQATSGLILGICDVVFGFIWFSWMMHR